MYQIVFVENGVEENVGHPFILYAEAKAILDKVNYAGNFSIEFIPDQI
jgi:hypothetical protein